MRASNAKEMNSSLIDMRFIKPIDYKAIIKASESHSLMVTVEDNSIMGGYPAVQSAQRTLGSS